MHKYFYQQEIRKIDYKGNFLDISRFFTEFEQKEIFSEGVCLTLSILLGELIKNKNESPQSLFYFISQNTLEIKSKLFNLDELLSSVHKKQTFYNKKFDIDFFNRDFAKDPNMFDLWGDFALHQLTSSINIISKLLFKNNNFRITKSWYILNEVSHRNTNNNQISHMVEKVNDYKAGLFIVSFSFGLFINKSSDSAIISTLSKNFHKSIEISSNKNHSCLLYISGSSFLFFDPNIGIVNQDIRNIESFFSYLYVYYDLVNKDENVFFFHEIGVNNINSKFAKRVGKINKKNLYV
ncbi:hypothetical protein SD28_07445 [Allofrancisella guangzhouensis]|uniref:Peptidase C58 YopT-type domain-containing protein n=3 Tax=Allofrancisella guangzhouensis TaxID=594679 RepID=A0A0A8E783_9GAMM|nr:hypothetical protein [Allofrancisella guangzhouensis]AJC49462.1 hypothetical protein SD28_07445 [Allofrancisella guangzhouensis]MBK2046163.1 hypothetical protein [Allofrancisella guangzhouensis]